jgi:aryl-alcohol dehydrogenase-like predicted oxidoreductase
MTMERRPFGDSGLEVSVMGFGGGHIGAASYDEDAAADLINAAVDAGVTFFDTARGYGLSKERLGRHLVHDDHIVVSTKVGYDVPGAEDWTRAAVTGGVDLALRRLQVDCIDVAFLHSCNLAVLQRGEVVEALEVAQAAGKVRVVGYSGENEALAWAVESGRFGAVQTSVNVADQWSLHHVLKSAEARGIGVVAKRPLANAPWRFSDRPSGHYAELYWDRLRALDVQPEDGDWLSTAVRCATFAPEVSTAIVGTGSPAHLAEAVAAAAKGPLPAAEHGVWRDAFTPYADVWPGDV